MASGVTATWREIVHIQYDQHVLAFRWHQHCWMAREYRHAGELFG